MKLNCVDTKGNDQFVELILGKDIFFTTNPFEGGGEGGGNPTWNVNLNLEITPTTLHNDPLKIRVKDKNGTLKDRVLGRAHVDTDKAALANGEWVDLTGDLLDGDGKTSGIYHLKARFRPKEENIVQPTESSSQKKLSPRPQPQTPLPPPSTEPGRLDIEQITVTDLKNIGNLIIIFFFCFFIYVFIVNLHCFNRLIFYRIIW